MLYLLDSPQCISGFISSDEIKIQARKITKVKEYDNDERFFPDIGFTCNGNITHIIIGAKNHNKDKLPQIRFWRLLDGGEYEQTGSSYPLVYNDANDPSTTNLRWYNLSQPIQVQNRNVLGISQPNKGKSDLILYYQENSGPPNYESNENMDDENNYPLVSIIFGKYFKTYKLTMYNVLYLLILLYTIAMSSSTPFSFSISESNTLSSTAESASSIISFITSETTGSPSTSKSSSSTITSTSETTSSTTSFTSEKNSTTSFTSETTSSTTSFTSETTSSTTSFTSETASSTTRFTSETTSSTTSFTSETTSSSTSFTSETPSSTIIFTSETTSSPVRITGDSRSSTISSTSESELIYLLYIIG